MSTESVVSEVIKERKRQDEKWGGPVHDDKFATKDFVQWIEDYAGWARMMDSMASPEKARNRLIQMAALAVAAVESLDRKPQTSIAMSEDVLGRFVKDFCIFDPSMAGSQNYKVKISDLYSFFSFYLARLYDLRKDGFMPVRLFVREVEKMGAYKKHQGGFVYLLGINIRLTFLAIEWGKSNQVGVRKETKALIDQVEKNVDDSFIVPLDKFYP